MSTFANARPQAATALRGQVAIPAAQLAALLDAVFRPSLNGEAYMPLQRIKH